MPKKQLMVLLHLTQAINGSFTPKLGHGAKGKVKSRENPVPTRNHENGMAPPHG
jgi:hypothetical protein